MALIDYLTAHLSTIFCRWVVMLEPEWGWLLLRRPFSTSELDWHLLDIAPCVNLTSGLCPCSSTQYSPTSLKWHLQAHLWYPIWIYTLTGSSVESTCSHTGVQLYHVCKFCATVFISQPSTFNFISPAISALHFGCFTGWQIELCNGWLRGWGCFELAADQPFKEGHLL